MFALNAISPKVPADMSKTSPEYEHQLAGAIDWNHPDLRDDADGIRAGSPREQLRCVIKRIREHRPEYFGFSSNYMDDLRATADAARVRDAEVAFDEACESDLFFPPHTNAYAAIGCDNLLLAINEQRMATLRDRVLARQNDWGRNIWSFGITRGVADLIRYLLPIRCCQDEDFLPLFGWLTQIAPIEWAASSRWSERELGCSGHNWWLASFLGLCTAGTLFPHFCPLEPFGNLLPQYLERESRILFESDGWSKEGAFGYHHLSVLHLVEFTRLAQRHGVKLSKSHFDRLGASAEATLAMLGPDGYAATFGDDTHPWPENNSLNRNSQQQLNQSRIADSLRALAARYELPHAKYICEKLYGDPPPWVASAGDNLTEDYNKLKATPPALDTMLVQSGLYAMRSGWTRDSDWLAINAMPVGPVVSSHKHADLFNLELTVRGRRVLVDNWYGDITADDGTYGSREDVLDDPMKRRWRVGSFAHNVLTIDDRDIVDVQQVYRYAQTERPLVDEFVSDPQYCFFSGVHEAYRRQGSAVAAHRRKLFYVRGGYWILIDRITPNDNAPHTLTQHFHMPPSARCNGKTFQTSGRDGNILIVPLIERDTQLNLEPNPYPIQGYQNPDHATVTRRCCGPMIMMCVLHPFVGADAPQVKLRHVPAFNADQSLTPWQATSVEVTVDGRSDYFFCQHTHWCLPWRSENHAHTVRTFHSAIGPVI